MNVTDILTRVQRQFGDESGVQLTQADVIRWINDAQQEAVMQHENLLQKASFLSSVANQLNYVLPADCFSLQTIAYKDNTTASFYELQPLTQKALTEYLGGWSGPDLLSGVPAYFARGETQNEFLILPAPDKAGVNNIKLTYARYPTDVVDTTSTIDLPIYYHQYVLSFCLMRAYEMDEDWESANAKAKYVQSTLDLNNSRDSWFGRQVYPSVVATSEDYQ